MMKAEGSPYRSLYFYETTWNQPRRHLSSEKYKFRSTGICHNGLGKSPDRLSASTLFLRVPLMVVILPDSKRASDSRILHNNLYLISSLYTDDTSESDVKNDS
jgi:hypothetical protein